jgi:hypothetical protein
MSIIHVIRYARTRKPANLASFNIQPCKRNKLPKAVKEQIPVEKASTRLAE